jgi:hypothetical protein
MPALVFTLDADAAKQPQWHQLARQAALRGKHVATVPAAAYGGCKDVSEVWAAGGLMIGDDVNEAWAERCAIMVVDGSLAHEDAARLAWGRDPWPAASEHGHGMEPWHPGPSHLCRDYGTSGGPGWAA